MPDPTIRITIEHVYYSVFGRAVGTGDGTIRATVNDGTTTTAIGNAAQVFHYRADRRVVCNWSVDMNVRNKNFLNLTVVCADSAGTEIARFQYRLNPEWRMFEHEVLYTKNASVVWSVSPRFGIGERLLAPYAVAASRSFNGAVSYTTVSGTPGEFRLEICPIRPVPPEDQLPRRPLIVRFRPAWQNGLGKYVRAGDPINVLPNPPIIPLLNPPVGAGGAAPTPAQQDNADSANQRNCARLECTFYCPETERFTDNDRRLEWRKISGAGNVVFIKYQPSDPNGTENRGLKVMVYGTVEGEVVLGVHFNNTVVARFRGLVHSVKRLACRFNILNGPNGPVGDLWRFTPPATPDHAVMHREIANRFLRQVGLMLVPDGNDTLTWANGRAVTRTTHPGVFRIRVNGPETFGISDNDSETLIRYNSRDNVLNFFYVRSHQNAGTGGAAVFWPNSKLGAAAGTIDDPGTPSSSWIRPSGNSPDGAAGTVSMRYIRGWPSTDPVTLNVFGMFITAAMGADPGGVDAMDYGYAVAHEVGHMVNLGHRVEQITNVALGNQWNAGTLNPADNAGGRIPQLQQGQGNLGADDGTWCDELWYPRLQNVMRWLAEGYMNQSFDILQARVVRQSPLLDLP